MPRPMWSQLVDLTTNKLSSDSWTHQIYLRLFEELTQVDGRTASSGTAPFQFTLPLMAGLHWDLNDLHSTDREDAIGSYMDALRESDTSRSVMHPPVESKPEACSRPLRAIAYFSWEYERRVFLARRVYPYYFDFLSYSSCPPGWGSLGKFLDEFERNRQPFGTQELNFTDSHRHPVETQRLLPYQAEIRRINHEAAMVIPILDEDRLEGAFLVCLAETQDLPTLDERAELKASLFDLRTKFANLLRHHKTIVTEPCEANDHSKMPLSEIWRTLAQAQEMNAQIAQLEIWIDNSHEHDLETILDHILANLQSPELYPIVERTADANHVKVLIAARSPSRFQSTEKIILDAAYDACAPRRGVTYSLSWLNRYAACSPSGIYDAVRDSLVAEHLLHEDVPAATIAVGHQAAVETATRNGFLISAKLINELSGQPLREYLRRRGIELEESEVVSEAAQLLARNRAWHSAYQMARKTLRNQTKVDASFSRVWHSDD